MAHITNGSVTYLRRVKTGDYEHKEAAIVVHYALDEGENLDIANEIIGRAGALALDHVHGVLRGKPPQPVASAPAPVAQPVVDLAPAVDSVPDPVPAVLEATADVELAPAKPVVTNLRAAKRAVKKVEDLIVDHEPTPDSKYVPEIVDVDFVAEAPAATDAELGQALARKNAALKDRPRIVALIGEFTQAGSSYTTIPGVRRAEFLNKLEALA